MGDVPFGIIISGGVDSSLVSSIAMRLVKCGEVSLKDHGMGTHVHSFCIGLEGSPDLKYAKQVAEFLGTKHHEIVFTVEEGLDAIPEVIYHTETFNCTTIRASTPMYIMSRIIKSLGIKILLCGEGADEIFGGYLYFHKAPNREEMHKENVRKVKALHTFDLLRGNKIGMAWGLELRPPFMHKKFIEYAMSFDPSVKMPRNNPRNIEKYILRAAFDDPQDPYLPDEILWRQKEQFSDGVGYKWINSIKELVERKVTDADWENREKIFPVSTPFSKEMFYIRSIFQEHFPHESCARTVPHNRSIACSSEAALEWDESFKKNADESGRAVLGIHLEAAKLQDAQRIQSSEDSPQKVRNAHSTDNEEDVEGQKSKST
jgi:asparagine synthase (glutamine-hydrolysing)